MTEDPSPGTGLAALRALLSRGEPDLFEGALLIARLIDPAEDVERARVRAEELAARVADRRASGEPGITALRQVLFSEEGFRGNSEAYDEPENSSVAKVFASGRGLPITLCLAVLEVARRAGFRLAGIGLPGHFVVGGAELPPGLYLDPFDGGTLQDERSLSTRVGEIFGAEVELTPEAFAPDAPRVILARVLANLRRSWERRGRFEEALEALSWAEAIEPGQRAHLRERGLLLLKLGRPEEALAPLETYVAQSSGEDAEAIAKLASIVRDRAAPPGGGGPGVPEAEKKLFTLSQVRQLLPRVQEITSEAVSRYSRLPESGETEQQRQGIVRDWAEEILSLGAEIKGLWLVDFDSGAGYYCWKYPEPSLEYFHGYDEGFAGRLPLQ